MSEGSIRARRRTRIQALLLGGLALLFLLLLVVNLGGWLIADDEGTDLYEAWRLQLGEQPGEDFFAEQQPLYLMVGAQLIEWFGHSVAALRAAAVITVVAGALVLALAVAEIWGFTASVTGMALILTSGLVVEQARLFRPDPMMFGWGMAGLGAALLGAHYRRTRWWAVAGALYGVSFLFKPFALFPILGLVFYFALVFWRERGNLARWRALLRQGLAFAATFILVGGAGSFLLYLRTGFYYGVALEQHLSVSQGANTLQRAELTVRYFFSLFIVNGVLLYLPALLLLNRRRPRTNLEARRLLLSILPAPLIFVLVSRPIFLRYFIFLLPVWMVLLGIEVQRTVNGLAQRQRIAAWASLLAVVAIIAFAVVTTRYKLTELILRREDDTVALADLVATTTNPEDIVLSDYATINFLAERPSIYEASIIAHGRITSGIVTARLLLESFEHTPPALILMHVPGGEKEPDHLYYLRDFDLFAAYLKQHYQQVRVFNRQGQRIVIYERRAAN